MVWAMIMKQNRTTGRLEPDCPIRITNMALESGKEAQIYLIKDGVSYMICTLTEERPMQAMDLMFDDEDGIKFKHVGDGAVHMVGKEEPYEDDEMSDSGDEESVSSMAKDLDRSRRSRLDSFRAKQRQR